MTLKKTPLNQIHRRLGARMIEFAGWEMPVQYHSALKEHLAVRERVGLFDISHMGELEIAGRDALALVQKVTCNDASRLSVGQAHYSSFLSERGTFVDDVVVYRLADDGFLICVNASNREKNFHWLQAQKEGEVTVSDRSDDYVQLALQGPRSQRVLQEITDLDLSSIRTYWFDWGRIGPADVLISRTGYTGEDGFELYFAPQHAEYVWNQIFEVGARVGMTPAGLAARNTLRLEMKYALYGNDIDDTVTPLEAGLGWIVKFGKAHFVGKKALEEQQKRGVERKLIGFEMVDRGIAREHCPVFVNGERIAQVTSGTFAPSLQKAVGLTYLPSSKAQIGQELHVEIRGKRLAARVTKTPFYQRS